jgi:hypothetical protein
VTRNASTLKDLAFSSLDDLWDQWQFAYSSRGQVRHDLESAPEAEPWFESRKPGETDRDWALRLRRCKLWHLMVSPNPEDRGVCDLRLMSPVKDVGDIPTGGKNLIIVAAVDQVLHFRIFDGAGNRVVDTDETKLPRQARPIDDLRKQLASLWSLQGLIKSEKDRVITAVTSIVGHTHRGFFQACKSARVQRREQPALGVWLEPGGPLEAILDFVDELRAEPRRRLLEPYFRAHLLCAREAVAPDFWPATGTVSEPALKRIQAGTKLPLNYLRDLAAELCDRPCSPGAEPAASVVVLLVEGKERGHTASLDFEPVSPGEGLIYPAPAISLISRDQDFRTGEETARDYVEKALDLPDPKRDIRWSLRMRESQPLPTEIYGPSASAAQALLLAYLRA